MAEQTAWSLPVAFYFKVTFLGQPSIDEVAFQEVSGLSAELDLDTWQEGGANDTVLYLPKAQKLGRLTLKRAMLPVGGGAGADLTDWVTKSLSFDEDLPIQRRDLLVHLLDAEGQTLHLWMCGDAYPIKWTTDGFESQKNAVAIINLELVYTTLKQTQ